MSLPVIISYANFGYLDFAENLLKNISLIIKNHKFVFYCLDNEIYEKLLKYKSNLIDLVNYGSNLSKQFENYGSAEYNKITHTKVNILKDALNKYDYIHFVDADIVFCKEPTIDYYEKYLEYDIVFQRDAPPPNEPFHQWTCTGNMTLKNTSNTIGLLDLISTHQNKNINDQECLREIFINENITDIRKYTSAKLYEYPMEEYTCGYCVKHNLVNFENIMVFHANHVIGKVEKINLLKMINKWYC